jgi:hypothetical protein
MEQKRNACRVSSGKSASKRGNWEDMGVERKAVLK